MHTLFAGLEFILSKPTMRLSTHDQMTVLYHGWFAIDDALLAVAAARQV
jgi:hypothetical protein